jgi:hypothetical protein
MCVGLNRRGQEKTLSFSLVWWRVGENLFRIVSEGCVPAEGCGGEGQFAAPHCIASVCKITDKRQLGSDLLMAFELIPAASAHPLLWLQDPHAADHSQKLFPGARLLFALDLIYGCTAHTHTTIVITRSLFQARAFASNALISAKLNHPSLDALSPSSRECINISWILSSI